MNTLIAEAAYQAADYIEQHGLHKGAISEDWSVEYAVAIKRGVRFCVMGALMAHLDRNLSDETTDQDAWNTLNVFAIAHRGARAADWNDHDKTTVADAVTLLRELAAHLDQDQSKESTT